MIVAETMIKNVLRNLHRAVMGIGQVVIRELGSQRSLELCVESKTSPNTVPFLRSHRPDFAVSHEADFSESSESVFDASRISKYQIKAVG
jgi:hypothetical protein